MVEAFFSIAQDDHLHCRLGPLELWIDHKDNELHIGSRSHRDPHLQTFLLEACEAPHVRDDCNAERYAVAQNGITCRFEAALPDRAIVTRPSKPLWVHGLRCVDIFVSSPIWTVLVDETTNTPLLEVSTLEMANTWFGPKPYEGELCYASRTQARIDPNKLLQHPFRAITRITIDNRLNDAVRIERLKIPMALLALYHDTENNLWTTSMRLERRQSSGPANIQLAEPKA